MPRQGKSTIAVRAERVYRRLLIVYPDRFRKEYGELLVQLFGDQFREVCERPTRARLALFWLRVLADLGLTASKEHIIEFCLQMKALSFRSYVAPGAVFIATCLVLGGLLVATLWLWLPNTYKSTARIALDIEEIEPRRYDPFNLQTQLERIKSQSILGPVIDELGLVKWLTDQTSSAKLMSKAEAYRQLRGMVDVRQIRNSAMLDFSIVSKDRVAGSEIANKIAMVYREQARAATPGTGIQVVDLAQPALRPFSPNRPLLLACGSLLILVLAAGTARLAQWGLLKHSRPV